MFPTQPCPDPRRSVSARFWLSFHFASMVATSISTPTIRRPSDRRNRLAHRRGPRLGHPRLMASDSFLTASISQPGSRWMRTWPRTLDGQVVPGRDHPPMGRLCRVPRRGDVGVGTEERGDRLLVRVRRRPLRVCPRQVPDEPPFVTVLLDDMGSREMSTVPVRPIVTTWASGCSAMRSATASMSDCRKASGVYMRVRRPAYAAIRGFAPSTTADRTIHHSRRRGGPLFSMTRARTSLVPSSSASVCTTSTPFRPRRAGGRGRRASAAPRCR